MRRKRRNAFLSQPDKFFGTQAVGTATVPGFHTASDIGVAVPYAQMKVEDFLPRDPDESDDPIADYPVIASLDMSGLQPTADYDANQSIEILETIVNELKGDRVFSERNETPIDRLENSADYGDQGDGEIRDWDGESATLALFDISGVNPQNLIYRLRDFANKKKDPNKWLRRVMASGFKDEELAEIIGQYRYTTDVDEFRIVEVAYMTPCWPRVFPEWDTEDYDEKIVEKVEASGYTTISVNHIYEQTDVVGLVPVYRSKTHQQVLKFVERRPLEFHGTSYRNLLSAAPFLEDRMPLPPTPYSPNAEK